MGFWALKFLKGSVGIGEKCKFPPTNEYNILRGSEAKSSETNEAREAKMRERKAKTGKEKRNISELYCR